MIEETLTDVIDRYTYLLASGNESFKKRMFDFYDDFKRVNGVKADEVPVKRLLSYMAVVDFENKVCFMGVNI